MLKLYNKYIQHPTSHISMTFCEILSCINKTCFSLDMANVECQV